MYIKNWISFGDARTKKKKKIGDAFKSINFRLQNFTSLRIRVLKSALQCFWIIKLDAIDAIAALYGYRAIFLAVPL